MAKFASPNFLDGGLSYLKTTGTVVSAGNTINWPALTYTIGQPT